jgi:superfamily I DNA/RNA helicase
MLIADARPEFSVREGCRPIVVRSSDEAAEGRFLAAEVSALLKYKRYGPRDICIVARNRHYRALAVASPKAASIPVYLFRDPEAGEVSPDEDAVQVSSLHGAKGHEFGTVVVIGAVEGVVPFGSNLDPQGMSSEAAVLYVGMTRARDLLYLSHAEIDRHEQDHYHAGRVVAAASGARTSRAVARDSNRVSADTERPARKRDFGDQRQKRPNGL